MIDRVLIWERGEAQEYGLCRVGMLERHSIFTIRLPFVVDAIMGHGDHPPILREGDAPMSMGDDPMTLYADPTVADLYDPSPARWAEVIEDQT